MWKKEEGRKKSEGVTGVPQPLQGLGDFGVVAIHLWASILHMLLFLSRPIFAPRRIYRCSEANITDFLCFFLYSYLLWYNRSVDIFYFIF